MGYKPASLAFILFKSGHIAFYIRCMFVNIFDKYCVLVFQVTMSDEYLFISTVLGGQLQQNDAIWT